MSGASSRLVSNFFRGLRHPIKSYKNVLEKHPIIVQSIQTGCLYVTSDLIAQLVIEQKNLDELNTRRNLIFLTTGVCFSGPIISLWFRFLAKKIGTKGKWVIVKKVLIDQLLFAPCLHLGLITTVNTLHGHDARFIEEQIKLKYFDIISTSIKMWPVVQLINFSFVPTNYQVLFGQIVALFWNVYLSWKTQHGVGIISTVPA